MRALLTIPVGKPYCWQACSPANLIPLQVYNSNFVSQSIKITNYFWPHCQWKWFTQQARI